MPDRYKKIKKQNGEAFARALRAHHNGLLEIPDIDRLVRHAGRDAEALLPYLMSLLAVNDDAPAAAPQDPFALLDRAGYDAFHADTLAKQNSIRKYFRAGELLCTFNDAARYRNYHIVHAVRKDVDRIRRADFTGREKREDAYGTSVISIQMLKQGGFISIKNRYNHAVPACDHTFDSNPDNIVDGLSAALKAHFNVDFSARKTALPAGFVLIGNGIFKYHAERNNIYYGDQAWAENGVIHAVDRGAGDALFDGFLFDNKTKTLKQIDADDTFPEYFNRCYGGKRGLSVQGGNLLLDGDVLIGAAQSRITSLYLPGMTEMGHRCLFHAHALTRFDAPALAAMGNGCLHQADALEQFHVPALATMGNNCLEKAARLTRFAAPALTNTGHGCLQDTGSLTLFDAPALARMGDNCLQFARALTHFSAPALETMGHNCLQNATALHHFAAPALVTMENWCLQAADALARFDAPLLTVMGDWCLHHAPALDRFDAPALAAMGRWSLFFVKNLTAFDAPLLAGMGERCLLHAGSLAHFNAPALAAMGDECLHNARALTRFDAPALVTMGKACLFRAAALTHFNAPALTVMGERCLFDAPSLAQFHAPAAADIPARLTPAARPHNAKPATPFARGR